jgi:hypothetical protein
MPVTESTIQRYLRLRPLEEKPIKRGSINRGHLREANLRAGLVLAYFRAGLVLRLAGGKNYIFRQSFVGQSYSEWLDFKIEAPKRDATI